MGKFRIDYYIPTFFGYDHIADELIDANDIVEANRIGREHGEKITPTTDDLIKITIHQISKKRPNPETAEEVS